MSADGTDHALMVCSLAVLGGRVLGDQHQLAGRGPRRRLVAASAACMAPAIDIVHVEADFQRRLVVLAIEHGLEPAPRRQL